MSFWTALIKAFQKSLNIRYFNLRFRQLNYYWCVHVVYAWLFPCRFHILKPEKFNGEAFLGVASEILNSYFCWTTFTVFLFRSEKKSIVALCASVCFAFLFTTPKDGRSPIEWIDQKLIKRIRFWTLIPLMSL